MTRVMPATALSMFDRVRVCTCPQTRALGVAGLVGQVRGFTTPSVTGVRPIAVSNASVAIQVHFEHGQDAWFGPELLELVDHAPGTRVGDWVRGEAGGYHGRLLGGMSSADRARLIDFQTVYSNLLYGLRSAGEWDLAKSLRAALGDGSFAQRNVRAFSRYFERIGGDIRARAASLPVDTATACAQLCVYLDLWRRVPRFFSLGETVTLVVPEGSGRTGTITSDVPLLGSDGARPLDVWSVALDGTTEVEVLGSCLRPTAPADAG
jgi:hypothetical protein